MMRNLVLILFCFFCEVSLSREMKKPSLEFLWGTKDTTLTFGQDLYTWEWFRNVSDTEVFVVERNTGIIEFWAKVEGREYLLSESAFTIMQNAVIMPRNSKFRIAGRSIVPHFDWVRSRIEGQIVARTNGPFQIRDSVKSVVILPPEDTIAMRWFSYIPLWSKEFGLSERTWPSGLTLPQRQKKVCDLAKAKYDSLTANTEKRLIFDARMQFDLWKLCKASDPNAVGVNNRNWPEYAEISRCSEQSKKNRVNLRQSCEYAFRQRNAFVRSIIHPEKRLPSDRPNDVHRFLSGKDTIIVGEGTWIGGIPGEKP